MSACLLPSTEIMLLKHVTPLHPIAFKILELAVWAVKISKLLELAVLAGTANMKSAK